MVLSISNKKWDKTHFDSCTTEPELTDDEKANAYIGWNLKAVEGKSSALRNISIIPTLFGSSLFIF